MDSLFVMHYARLVIVSEPGPVAIHFAMFDPSAASVPIWQVGGFEP